MSLRSTMDLGLAALTAPSESSGSAVGMLTVVGAAVAGLAALGVAVAASDIGKLPVFSIPENQQPFRKIAGRGRSRSATVPWWLPGPGRGRKFVLFAKDDEELLVRADELQEQGNPLGELIALQMAKRPYILALPDDTLTESHVAGVAVVDTTYDRIRATAWEVDMPTPLTEQTARQIARGLLDATGHGEIELPETVNVNPYGGYARFPNVPDRTMEELEAAADNGEPYPPSVHLWLTKHTFHEGQSSASWSRPVRQTVVLQVLSPKSVRRSRR